MFIRRLIVILLATVTLSAAVGHGQWRRGRPLPDRGDYPTWENAASFEEDVFTFVRIRYNSRGSVVDSRWDNDYPDADWNFSFRLQQLTSLKVDPQGKVLELSNPALFDYPFVFLLGVRDLYLSEAEVRTLRRYLLNGGFLMVDDFWAYDEWQHIRREMERVFPGRQPVELEIDHEIFHMVYDLKEKPQVPSIQAWRRGWDFEYWHGDHRGDKAPHFWGYLDDQGRLMALLCHNNDLCDGWEREGENTEYFHLFSEKWSYPFGINVVAYAMTH